VFVADRDDRVSKLNETAGEALAASPTAPLGDSFASLTDRTVASPAETDTVALDTDAGKRTFDPEVTEFQAQRGRRLGSLLGLRDVTERELRKRRLEVVKRVLRHSTVSGPSSEPGLA
jgi:hypothetical protein